MRLKNIKVVGGYAYIALTKGYEAIVDVSELYKVQNYNWCSDVRKNTVYALRADYSTGKRRTVTMHRTIMGDCQDFLVDHIDGNGLNNTKENLRLADHSQNQHNRKKYSNNKSGYKGVSFNKFKNKYQAVIGFNSKLFNLGYFDTAEEAYQKYCEEARKFHKDFVRLE